MRVPRGSIVRGTWVALLTPRRLVPTTLVASALIVAQAQFEADWLAVPLAGLMCLAFILLAPVSWRVLFPHGLELSHGGIRLLLYGAVGVAFVLGFGVVIPDLVGMGPSLLTSRASLFVCLALFLVGGWGLGHDIDRDARLANAEARAEQSARAAERAELLALRSHLDPHFLFNTLNAIAEWCREDGAVAEGAVLRLSSMLRTILTGVRTEAWSLAEELALIDTLFELHRLRDPDGLQVVRTMPSPVPLVMVPPMLLIPLAENAMKHGPGAGHRGPVTLDLEVVEHTARVRIGNAGAYGGPRDGGEGLKMVERRLALAFGRNATFRISDASDGEGARTIAEVVLPLRDAT